MAQVYPPPPYIGHHQASSQAVHTVMHEQKNQNTYELMAETPQVSQFLPPPPGYQPGAVNQQQPLQEKVTYPPPPGYAPTQQLAAQQYTQSQQQPTMITQAAQQFVSSIPPEKLHALQQVAQQQQLQHFSPPPQQSISTPPGNQQQTQKPSYVSTAPAGFFGSKTSHGNKHDHSSDSQQSGKVQRFLGDTLFGRVARASVQTASSAMKMPAALSPWGDNNPVTLPNVRYRDAVLFTVFAGVGTPLVDGADSAVTDLFGADSFVSDVVSSSAGFITGSTIVKYSVFQIVEQAIDKGVLEHMLPEEEKIIQTLNVKSLQVGIKHKLMGANADIRFHAVRPTQNSQACYKGWFAPYLFASARTPVIPRANDFSIAQFFGPFLGADYAMAHKLLAEAPHALSMCDPDPSHDIGTNRMVVVFTAISPYRANMWSTSRRPGCGTIIFHVFDGCPALILPVTKKAPVVAWSPWTLAQMRGATSYQAAMQHEEICDWLDGIVSHEHLNPAIASKYVEVLGRAMSLVINGALGLEKVQDKTILGKVDPERAGIVMFRF